MIRLTQVTKRFGDKEALRRVDLTLQRGEVVALIGHNGAGKTTTLRLMADLMDPARERFNGLRISKQSWVFPDVPFAFDYLTGWEMLCFIASLYRLPKDDVQPRSGIT